MDMHLVDPIEVLIERWHTHARDGDPEADAAAHALAVRLATLRGYAMALVDLDVASAGGFVMIIDGNRGT